MSLSKKENSLATFRFEKADYVPMTSDAVQMTGYGVSGITDCPLVDGGIDLFGVPWSVNREGSITKSGFVMFDDIADWEKYVKIPNLDSIDIKGLAAKDMANKPLLRDERVIDLFRPTGLFMRLVALMNFENALLALFIDPESCKNFFEALTEYMIKWNDLCIDAYGPDVLIYCDDVAAARSLFMSPDCYREVIAPYEKAIVQAALKHDIIVERHCCGKCYELIPDWIDMGITVWHAAQSVNDIAGDLEVYRGRMAIEGGWDTTGPASWIGATMDDLRAETRRCMAEYKKPGYMFCPIVLNERGNSLIVGDDRMPALEDEWRKYRDFDGPSPEVGTYHENAARAALVGSVAK